MYYLSYRAYAYSYSEQLSRSCEPSSSLFGYITVKIISQRHVYCCYASYLIELTTHLFILYILGKLYVPWFSSYLMVGFPFVNSYLSKNLYLLYKHFTTYLNLNCVNCSKNTMSVLQVKAPRIDDR
jgi:hypothetical protein